MTSILILFVEHMVALKETTETTEQVLTNLLLSIFDTY